MLVEMLWRWVFCDGGCIVQVISNSGCVAVMMRVFLQWVHDDCGYIVKVDALQW